MASLATMDSLPNEILMTIFSTLPTRTLLLLLEVSHHFYDVAVRVLHLRLLQAAPLPKHRLIFEFYYPSAKITTPYLVCNYLYTDTLPSEAKDGSGLAGLTALYSHFLPEVTDPPVRRRLRSWAPPMAPSLSQAQLGNNTGGSTSAAAESLVRDIHLDENVLFSQLCTVTNLVKVGPRPGLFLSHVNVSESVIRVWRDWLAARAQTETPGDAMSSKQKQRQIEPEPILWADATRHVGLRVRVVEKLDGLRTPRRPLLMGADEEPAVSYRLEVEEVLVRTNQLLMKLEESEVQEVDLSGPVDAAANIGFFDDPRGSVPQPMHAFFWAGFSSRMMRPQWGTVGSA